MAQLTFPVTVGGLAVSVLIGLDGQTTTNLVAVGLPVPSPILARGLLDTGSNVTSVAGWIVRQLGIAVSRTAQTQTAAGPVSVNLYSVSLGLLDAANLSGPSFQESTLVVSEFPALLQDTDVLVGLDVLLQLKLRLDGPARQFILEF